MKKIGIVVCGVQFGKFYIEACKRSQEIELKGILSRGSKESCEIAKQYKVPLYTSAEDISSDTADIVLAATRTLITGGRSSSMVKKLLEKGISVIQEQPVHEKEAADISKNLIDDKKQGYCINNFYRFLPSVQQFLFYVSKVINEHRILRFHLSCSSQVLYPLIDVLYEMLGGIAEFNVNKILDGNMNVLAGTINNIPFILNYYNEYSEDNDGSLALFFDIKIDTDAGNLILNDPEGKVIWQSHLSYQRGADFSSEKFKNLQPLECLFDGNVKSYEQRYTEVWPKAMEESIKDFYKKTLAGNAKEVSERTLGQCKICSDIADVSGKPRKIEGSYLSGISMQKFSDASRDLFLLYSKGDIL
ncbi:MAG: Gfo/Idh/MocA family oxidoreductase [Muricomes sp.]